MCYHSLQCPSKKGLWIYLVTFMGKPLITGKLFLTSFFSSVSLPPSPLFTYEKKNWVPERRRDLPDNKAGVQTPGTDLGWGLDGKDPRMTSVPRLTWLPPF